MSYQVNAVSFGNVGGEVQRQESPSTTKSARNPFAHEGDGYILCQAGRLGGWAGWGVEKIRETHRELDRQQKEIDKANERNKETFKEVERQREQLEKLGKEVQERDVGRD